MHTIGIVADDLTGAGDSAAQFAQSGWRTHITLDNSAPHRTTAGAAGHAFAIVTDARALSFSAARSATIIAVSRLEAQQIDCLFVKIDSTGRGSLAAQIDGALHSWMPDSIDTVAVVCPAYPQLGRTLEDGRIFVDNLSAEKTAAGSDPVTPLATALIAELIPGSTNITISSNASALIQQIVERTKAGFRIITINASTDEHLEIIAEALIRLGPRAIPVGSAGLARALSSQLRAHVIAFQHPHAKDTGRVIVVISSLHEASRAQRDHLKLSVNDTILQTFEPGLADLRSGEKMSSWIKANVALKNRKVSVVVSPTIRGIDADSPARVASGLAQLTEALVGSDHDVTLVLVGGEGARAVLMRLGATAITISHSLGDGIPVGIIEGGALDGVAVVTKAGGFGGAAALTDLLPQILT